MPVRFRAFQSKLEAPSPGIVFETSHAVSFNDGDAGHLYTITAGAPAVGQTDILLINSNTVLDSVTSGGGTAWSQRVDATDQQGAYLYTRKAGGGEDDTITINTNGNHNTDLIFARFSGLDAWSTGGFVRANNSNNTVLPDTATGALAQADMLLIYFGALHNFDGAAPVTPIWDAPSGTDPTDMGAVSLGDTSSAAVAAFGAYKIGVNPAGEDIDLVSWTNNARNRYALWGALTGA